MFLKKVFKERKWIFFLMVCFIIGQILISYKRGMLFSPFINLWMYNSEYKKDTQKVILFFSGKDTLQSIDYSSTQWDKIILSFEAINNIDKQTQFYYTQILPISSKLGIPLNKTVFLNSKIDSAYLRFKWKQYVCEITGKQIDSVQFSTYDWQDNKMIKQ
jgi:hypothetical protein